MWHLGTWVRGGLGSAGGMAGSNNPIDLSQPKQFNDFKCLIFCLYSQTSWSGKGKVPHQHVQLPQREPVTLQHTPRRPRGSQQRDLVPHSPLRACWRVSKPLGKVNWSLWLDFSQGSSKTSSKPQNPCHGTQDKVLLLTARHSVGFSKKIMVCDPSALKSNQLIT